MQQRLFKHFNSMVFNDFLNGTQWFSQKLLNNTKNVRGLSSLTFLITLTDKTDGEEPKKKEDYWRRTLKTFSLIGDNDEDSV